jgi:hypothetical protein
MAKKKRVLYEPINAPGETVRAAFDSFAKLVAKNAPCSQVFPIADKVNEYLKDSKSMENLYLDFVKLDTDYGSPEEARQKAEYEAWGKRYNAAAKKFSPRCRLVQHVAKYKATCKNGKYYFASEAAAKSYARGAGYSTQYWRPQQRPDGWAVVGYRDDNLNDVAGDKCPTAKAIASFSGLRRRRRR